MDEPNAAKLCVKIIFFWPLTASTTSDVKNDHAYVITQGICNKFIEVNFFVGCMVWWPNLFLYYEESLVLSSNLNSKLFRFHCVRPNVYLWCRHKNTINWKSLSHQSHQYLKNGGVYVYTCLHPNKIKIKSLMKIVKNKGVNVYTCLHQNRIKIKSFEDIYIYI